MHDWLADAVAFIVHWVEAWGYLGIFIMTMLESTFVPVPSEVTLLPAGYLIYEGKMDPFLVFLTATSGTITGALFNYYIALKFGRAFIQRYGRYMFMGPQTLDKMENFFVQHGAISTFTGRLIPGVRHFISFPAGLARMDLKRFCFYTGIGGAIWAAVLLTMGYLIGHNEELIKRELPLIKLGIAALAVLYLAVHVWRKRRARKALGHSNESSQPE